MSKPINVVIPHELGRAEARRRVEEGFGRFAEHMGGSAGALSSSWEADRLVFAMEVMGQRLSGMIDVAEDRVSVELLLPGLLGLVAGRIKGRLQSEGQLLLDKK